MPSVLGRNLGIAFLSLVPLWYIGFFGSYFFHLLETLIIACFVAAALTPKWPDPLMDPVASACINKKRLLPAGAQTHLTLVLYFKKCPTLQAVTESFRSLGNYERFHSIPIPAKHSCETSWKKIDKFEITDYIGHYVVANSAEREKQVNDITVGTLRPLDPAKSLWRVDILDCQDGDSVVVWILDHSMGDALSLLPIGLNMATTLDGKPYSMPTFEPNRGTSVPILQRLKSALADVQEVASVPTGPFDTPSNWNRNAEKKVFDYDSNRQIATIPDFDFNHILEIKKKLPAGYTVNDVFTALFTGTIRRYLEKTGDQNLNEKMLLRGQAPFALPRPQYPNKTQNKLAFVVFRFPVGLPSLKRRFEAIHTEFVNLKTSIRVPLLTFITNAALALGLDNPLCDANLQQWHRTSCIFSNVAGPREQLLLFGEPLLSFKPYYCNMLSQAIFFSYAGKVSLAMVLDSSNIKKPHMIGECFKEELEALSSIDSLGF